MINTIRKREANEREEIMSDSRPVKKLPPRVFNKYLDLENPELPRLPVPTLEDTCKRYLRTVRAITTDAEFENTSKIVEEFQNGPGRELQEELERFAKETPTNWIEPLWNTMYNELRCPTMIHVNPHYGIVNDPTRQDRITRAASLIASSIRFQDYQRAGMKTDMARNVPMCMSQYGRLLGSTKIPAIGRDIYYENMRGDSYVVVIANGQFYKLDTRRDDPLTGPVIPEEELQVHLRAIWKDSQNAQQPPIGVLTGWTRDEFARARGKLLNVSENNRVNLKVIEDALLVISLESDNTPDANLEDLARILMHGDGQNRFFDKSVQLMVGKTGLSGVLMEHTGFDGHSILHYVHWISENAKNFPVKEDANVTPQVNLLKFDVDASFTKDLNIAKAYVADQIAGVEITMLEHTKFGKGLVKTFKCSPDAFLQMAYQLAYYRIHGAPGSTYESCNAKRFYRGRTTCIRSCQVESVRFTKVMEDENASKEDKVSALRDAIARQVEISKNAQIAQDVDRPLFGLQFFAQHFQRSKLNFSLPAIFTDPSYVRMKTDLISTSSSSGSPYLNMFGFGPTSAKCYGCGYVIAENYINVCISSFVKGASKTFSQTLEKSLSDMADLFA